MQHFMIPCDFGGRKAPFPIYVGEPKVDAHPLHYQAWWLSSARGGTIPQEVMDSFEKLHKIALENNVSFEELCVYAMGEALADQNTPNHAQAAAPAQPQMQQQQQYEAQPAAPYAEQMQPHENHQAQVEASLPNPNDPYQQNQG